MLVQFTQRGRQAGSTAGAVKPARPGPARPGPARP